MSTPATPEELLRGMERFVGCPFPCPLTDEQVDALCLMDTEPAKGGRSCLNCIHNRRKLLDGSRWCIMAGSYRDGRKKWLERPNPDPSGTMCNQWKRGYRHDGPVTDLPLGAN